MARLSPELLAQCLAEVESGRLTVEECLAAHPAFARELRPLIELALSVAPVRPARPDPDFCARGRAALLGAIAAERAQSRQSFWRHLPSAFGIFFRPAGRVAMPAFAIALVLTLVASGGSAIYAAQDTVPGDALYPLKMAVERVQLAATGDDEAKAAAYLDLAAKRVAEVEKASTQANAQAAEAAADALVAQLDQADAHLIRAAAAGRDVSALADRLAGNLAHLQAALAAAEQRAAGSARPALAKAVRAAGKGLAFATTDSNGAGAVGKPAEHPAAADSRSEVSAAGSVTLTQAISDVQKMAADSGTAGNSFNGLLAKLKAAQAAIARGQHEVAAQVLDAFASELNAMHRAGNISAQQYNALYTEYSAVIDSLGSTPKGRVVPGPVGPGGGAPTATPGPERRPEDDSAPVGSGNPHGSAKDQPTRVPRGR